MSLLLRLTTVAVISLSGCAATAPVTCEQVVRDPPPPLSCEAAVDAAQLPLAGLTRVTALDFVYDECAPNAARCEFLFGTAGNVIATLDDGQKVAAFVSIDEGGAVRVGEPRSYFPELVPTPLQ